MLTRLVAVAQVGERNAGERHLDEGRALVAQGPADSVKLHCQAAGPLQLYMHTNSQLPLCRGFDIAHDPAELSTSLVTVDKHPTRAEGAGMYLAMLAAHRMHFGCVISHFRHLDGANFYIGGAIS